MSTLSSKDVKIRKPQQCSGCCRTFPPGATLQKCSGVDHGDWWSAYWCEVCQECWMLGWADPGDLINPGYFIDCDRDEWEKIRERVEESSTVSEGM